MGLTGKRIRREREGGQIVLVENPARRVWQNELQYSLVSFGRRLLCECESFVIEKTIFIHWRKDAWKRMSSLIEISIFISVLGMWVISARLYLSFQHIKTLHSQVPILSKAPDEL